MKSFTIGKRRLGVGPCYIIAEIGSNHAMQKERAFELITRCSEAGVDAVKFQLFSADRIEANIDLPETRLFGQFAKHGKSSYDLFKEFELPVSWLKEIKACADENHVDFLVTPFDEHGADVLAEVGVPAMKVASFEITHIPLLKHLGGIKLPVLISTGMANLGDIEAAMQAVRDGGEDRIGLFHCGIAYPAKVENVNLRSMETMRLAFGCPVGYSDHTEGITVPVAAAALGAAMFEKHVTMAGANSPDHEFALDVEDLPRMVTGIHDCEAALGTNTKERQPSEEIFSRRGRRSLFVIRDVKKGERFSTKNLAVLRPGTGLPPRIFEEVLGQRATRTIKAVHQLQASDYC
ncbi:MAG: N-acetylneuraminate synthase family protein [Syntrophales bacterium]